MKVTELLEQVDAKIKDSTDTVANRVVDGLVEQELAARTNAFNTVLGKLRDARNAAKKIKPDGETWPVGADGLPGSESVKTFSKAKMDELKKNGEEQKKLEAALNKALEGDFSKVKELGGKGGKPSEDAAAE